MNITFNGVYNITKRIIYALTTYFSIVTKGKYEI